MKAVKKAVFVVTTLAIATLALPALAVAPDYTTLTSSVDFGSVITGILALAAVIMGVYVVVKGVKFLFGMLRGA